ncbi:MAG TPA: sensor domain-containing diguanylate cyclase [Pseudomonas sp.]
MSWQHLLNKWRQPEFILVSASSLVVVALLLIILSLLSREHHEANENAARAASNIVQLIDADVLRNAELYDTSLQGMISAWQRPDLMSISPELRYLVLFDRFTSARFKGDLLLLDKQGFILADSTSVHPRPENISDRPHFQKHAQDPSPDLKVDGPFRTRWGFKDWCISFSRRMSAPDGSFMGVASGAMRLSYFKQLFRSVDIGPGSSVSLINTRGFMLARHPEIPGRELIGEDFSEAVNFKRIVREGSGSFTNISALDGTQRLYTFSRVGDLPLIVVVGQSIDEVYAIWRRNALLVGLATSVLCLGIFGLNVLLRRELRLRRQAETELKARAETDALTGLANRRKLDEVLRIEWLRAMRSGKPLALLMVDVDNFKAFNARHGHHGGDEALRNVAQAITRNIRRPSDFVARYGGEEFVVALAETDLEGARIIAENIRQGVQALPAYRADTQAVTVSIGIACAVVKSGDVLAELIDAADKALYEAKDHGRNRVEISAL